MGSKGKFDVDKLNIDGSLKKLHFHISKFNVTGCDFCMNDGRQKAVHNVVSYFLIGSSMNIKEFKNLRTNDKDISIFGVVMGTHV